MPFVVEFSAGPIGCHLRHFVRGKGDRACAGFTVEHLVEGSPAAQTMKIDTGDIVCTMNDMVVPTEAEQAENVLRALSASLSHGGTLRFGMEKAKHAKHLRQAVRKLLDAARRKLDRKMSRKGSTRSHRSTAPTPVPVSPILLNRQCDSPSTSVVSHETTDPRTTSAGGTRQHFPLPSRASNAGPSSSYQQPHGAAAVPALALESGPADASRDSRGNPSNLWDASNAGDSMESRASFGEMATGRQAIEAARHAVRNHEQMQMRSPRTTVARTVRAAPAAGSPRLAPLSTPHKGPQTDDTPAYETPPQANRQALMPLDGHGSSFIAGGGSAAKRTQIQEEVYSVDFVGGNTGLHLEAGTVTSDGKKFGAIVKTVVEGSPAQQANIKPGDVVTQVNDKFVQNSPFREIRKPFKAFKGEANDTAASSRRLSLSSGHLFVTFRTHS